MQTSTSLVSQFVNIACGMNYMPNSLLHQMQAVECPGWHGCEIILYFDVNNFFLNSQFHDFFMFLIILMSGDCAGQVMFCFFLSKLGWMQWYSTRVRQCYRVQLVRIFRTWDSVLDWYLLDSMGYLLVNQHFAAVCLNLTVTTFTVGLLINFILTTLWKIYSHMACSTEDTLMRSQVPLFL